MNRFAADVLERAAVTFAEAFCAALLLSLAGAPMIPSFSIVEKAAAAGLVAVLSLLKGVFAGLLGNQNSAALLPAKADPAPSSYYHNPVPPLDPFADLQPPPAKAPASVKAPAAKAAKRARNA